MFVHPQGFLMLLYTRSNLGHLDIRNFLAPFPCCGKNRLEVLRVLTELRLSEYSVLRQDHDPWLLGSLEQGFQTIRRFPVAQASHLVCSILSRNLAFWSKLPETQIFSMKHSSVSKFLLSDEIHLTKEVLATNSQFPFTPLWQREWTIKISMLTLQQEAQVKRVEM